jgi:hypothetical protein
MTTMIDAGLMRTFSLSKIFCPVSIFFLQIWFEMRPFMSVKCACNANENYLDKAFRIRLCVASDPTFPPNPC